MRGAAQAPEGHPDAECLPGILFNVSFAVHVYRSRKINAKVQSGSGSKQNMYAQQENEIRAGHPGSLSKPKAH